MKSLIEIWTELKSQGFGSDKGDLHSYLPIYKSVLAPYRNGTMLEIGLFKGDSLRMWELYFAGDVYGVDCDVEPHGGLANLAPMIETGEHNIYIFDAASSEQVWEHFGGKQFDVIIEDAGHYIEQQLEMYRIFKEYLAPGGVYIIEDIQDIENHRHLFENIDTNKYIEIIDNRKVKGRYDDVIVIIKDKK